MTLALVQVIPRRSGSHLDGGGIMGDDGKRCDRRRSTILHIDPQVPTSISWTYLALYRVYIS